MTSETSAGSNWAGNVTYAAPGLHEPTSVEELQELVAASPRIRALGTRHSFSLVADAPVLVSVAGLPERVEVDAASSTATVSAGLRWGDVAAALHAQGYALRNMGSLPHIGVAGAVATATHGSGDGNGNLATAVVGLEVVLAGGELHRLSREADGDSFDGSIVGLGALGVVTAVTLEIVPTYNVRQDVYEDLPWDQAIEHLDEVMADGYSVSLFTTWRAGGVDQVWRKRVVAAGAGAAAEPAEPAETQWRGARPAVESRHPLPGLSGASCTEQLGVPGPWHERLPHFRLDMVPSSGDELQSEYFVDRSHGPAAVEALYGLRELIRPVLQVSEIRSVAADTLWVSPAYGRDSLGLHFTWVRDQQTVERVLEVVEAALAPYAPRPALGQGLRHPSGRGRCVAIRASTTCARSSLTSTPRGSSATTSSTATCRAPDSARGARKVSRAGSGDCVVDQECARRGCGRSEHGQTAQCGLAAEQGPALSNRGRRNDQAELVDEAGREQRASELDASVDPDVTAALPLEVAHELRCVPLDAGRVHPGSLQWRRRRNVLVGAVDEAGEGFVIRRRPVRSPFVIGSAPQQHRVLRLEDLGKVGVHLVVEIEEELVRRLGHAIKREQRVDHHLAHRDSSLAGQACRSPPVSGSAAPTVTGTAKRNPNARCTDAGARQRHLCVGHPSASGTSRLDDVRCRSWPTCR